MIKSTYLGEKEYFDTFEQAKEFCNHEEATDILDLNDILRAEADGMASPILEEI